MCYDNGSAHEGLFKRVCKPSKLLSYPNRSVVIPGDGRTLLEMGALVTDAYLVSFILPDSWSVQA